MQRVNRRRFVEGLSAGLGMSVGGLWPRSGLAQSRPREISGTEFNLEVGPLPVNLTGQAAIGLAVNGSIPAPTLRWRQGEEVTIHVTNRLAEPTSMHWHGILLPWNMDGVPGLSFAGIAPGSRFTYRFRAQQSGTYWYHSHTGFQEQRGLYGALIVDPAGADPVAFDREHAIVLSDWTDEDSMRVFARLKKASHYYNFQRRTLADIRAEIARKGRAQVRADRAMWNRMRMTDTDISDVTGATYTYLVNGQPPAADAKLLFRRGERVRLRIINASSMTFFDIRIPGLDMTVVAADGQNVEPVSVHELRIGVAETFDVIVTPNVDSAYALFAQAIDRSGYARATLTPDLALSAEVPPMDPPPVLGMLDMGMAMRGMTTAGASIGEHGLNHRQMDTAVSSQSAVQAGPGVAMQAENAMPRYDDPGVGLRDRSWKVLSYGDLRTLGMAGNAPEPAREIELHLTGNMDRYMWSFDGLSYSESEPIPLELGERVRFVLVNDTMMHHPIHLHGLWSDLETGTNGETARMHSVVVQPGQRVAYHVTAHEPGPWAYHCHLMHHMEAGMFRVVNVS